MEKRSEIFIPFQKILPLPRSSKFNTAGCKRATAKQHSQLTNESSTKLLTIKLLVQQKNAKGCKGKVCSHEVIDFQKGSPEVDKKNNKKYKAITSEEYNDD